MSLAKVPSELAKHALKVDCVAWYPWIHTSTTAHNACLAFDSCGIFYIGGNVDVTLPWSIADVPVLTAVAGEIRKVVQEAGKDPLHEHGGTNHPGQHWQWYRSKKEKETLEDKNLHDRLQELLQPSTTEQELQQIPKCNPWYNFSRYLELNLWRVGDTIHNGAHFPLCMWTHNASARSKEAASRRAAKYYPAERKWRGWNERKSWRTKWPQSPA